jgi:hypothetical protein
LGQFYKYDIVVLDGAILLFDIFMALFLKIGFAICILALAF